MICIGFDITGPVNIASPNPVTNQRFTEVLANVLSRPAFLRVPTSILEITLGKEMADALLLASTRVTPKKLTENSYPWRYPELDTALTHLLR